MTQHPSRPDHPVAPSARAAPSRLSLAAYAEHTPPLMVGGEAISLLTFRQWMEKATAHHGSATVGRPMPFVPRLDGPSVAAMQAALEGGVPLGLLHPRLAEGERGAAVDLLQTELPDGPGTIALVAFTSGSAGRPKGVCLSTEALLAAAHAHGAHLGWEVDDRWLLGLPLSHAGGFMVWIRCLLAGKTVVLQEGTSFDAGRVVRQMERDRVTLPSFVPPMLERVVAAGLRAPDRLRAVLLGGARATDDLVDRGRDLGWPLCRTYGATETCGQVATERPDDVATGSPPFLPLLPGVHAETRDGVLALDGPMLFSGYLGEGGGARARPWISSDRGTVE
ncbi:MAG: AMP-binding protein, partial [Myxococcales bacterium]|nr:AMP-binding protein [Myxococcales bacterium]